MTQQKMLETALVDIGVAADGEPVEPEYLTRGQVRFNMLVDDFKTERLLIYQVLRSVFTAAGSQASYAIGPGATWDVPTRPLAIVRAGFVNTTVNPVESLETPMRVYTDEEWADIRLKTLTSTIAWGLWYETSYKQTAPIGSGRVFIYPILTSAGQVALYLPQAIDELSEDETGLATTVYVPPGYRRGFVTSLSMDLCDSFEIDPKPSLVTKWKLAMKRIKRSNTKAATLRLPAALTRRGRRGGGGYNILNNQ